MKSKVYFPVIVSIMDITAICYHAHLNKVGCFLIFFLHATLILAQQHTYLCSFDGLLMKAAAWAVFICKSVARCDTEIDYMHFILNDFSLTWNKMSPDFGQNTTFP